MLAIFKDEETESHEKDTSKTIDKFAKNKGVHKHRLVSGSLFLDLPKFCHSNSKFDNTTILILL